MSVYGWSACLLAGASRGSFAEQLFPGCVVIVKEGDLGFLLKSRRAEHLFKEALGVWMGGGGGRQDGPMATTSKNELDKVGQKGEGK